MNLFKNLSKIFLLTLFSCFSLYAEQNNVLEVEPPADERINADQMIRDPDVMTWYIVDQLAKFNGDGGIAEMYKWISEHVKYPSEAIEEGVKGRVIVNFVIERDGSIKQAKVIASVHPALDAEAIRVVKAMPKWTPARHQGKPVRVGLVIPVDFGRW